MTTIRVECPECQGKGYVYRAYVDRVNRRLPCSTCEGLGWLPGKVGVVPTEGPEREREGVRA